ncbi:P27 family phage terminase small subunit [Sporosarcina sp. A2]|uniref:P27 family phage terminase small subunit n=1 Tax=Sporosarcina sp. A2 TaxID=3393449 RepID=UPI003D7BAFF8
MEIDKILQQLLSKIDCDDLIEVKKIHRYIQLLKLDVECDLAIERDGATIIVENGKQRFIKTHPSMTEKMKINTQLIALEKTFNFISEGTSPPPTASTVDDKEAYTADDLV